MTKLSDLTKGILVATQPDAGAGCFAVSQYTVTG